MSAWEQVYQEKLRTPEEVARMIPDDRWFFCGSREATAILKAGLEAYGSQKSPLLLRTDQRRRLYFQLSGGEGGLSADRLSGKQNLTVFL